MLADGTCAATIHSEIYHTLTSTARTPSSSVDYFNPATCNDFDWTPAVNSIALATRRFGAVAENLAEKAPCPESDQPIGLECEALGVQMAVRHELRTTDVDRRRTSRRPASLSV